MIPAVQRLSVVAREKGWKNEPIHGMANRQTPHQ